MYRSLKWGKLPIQCGMEQWEMKRVGKVPNRRAVKN